MSPASLESAFRREYAAHRASEGRALDASALFELPYLHAGPLARQWEVRARSFDAFVSNVLQPLSERRARSLDVADLGAGNGWLSWRLAAQGHAAVAVDVRDDDVDGLGAARPFVDRAPDRVTRCVASFDHVPLGNGSCDLVVFNASLHYSTHLPTTLREACRVLRAGGRLVVIDSPFYEREADGEAMREEKRRNANASFGSRAAALMALSFVEYLTRDRLEAASTDVRWVRHRVRYPMWYEMRPVIARLNGRRAPSRFDVWEGVPS